jgi:hypothetical protein
MKFYLKREFLILISSAPIYPVTEPWLAWHIELLIYQVINKEFWNPKKQKAQPVSAKPLI